MYGQLWSFVIMLCFWPIGPLQHGASVLVDAGQRWSFGEENNGEFSAVASTFPAWRPPQNGTDGSTYATFKGDFTFALQIHPFVSPSCHRFYQLEQWMMRVSWRRWGDAGRKTNMCCVLTQLWQFGITTTVLVAQGSTGAVFEFWATHI